jgi:tetratricopeptide (TPR) repeat protein
MPTTARKTFKISSRRCVLLLTAVVLLSANSASAQDESNLLPKYGLLPKTEAARAADKVFISGMDEEYHGGRKKAASFMAMRGWQYLKGGDPDDAMRRFNQAWLLENKNGTALWGMAAVEADKGKYDDSIKLFAEAQKSVSNEINFLVDYARTVGTAAVAQNDDRLLKDALNRFQQVYKKAPQNGRNPKNWAMVLYQKERYSEAWAKVKLAETTPDKNQLDPSFIKDLEARMPRPKD